MGDRDAFGREQGEDTLADMGWRGDAAPAADPMSAGEAVHPFSKPVPVNKRPPAPVTPAPVAPAAAAPAAPAPGPPTDVFEAPRPAFTAPRGYSRPRRRGGFGMARLLFFVVLLGIAVVTTTTVFTAGKHAVSGIRDRINEAVTPASPTATPKAAAAGSLLRAKPLRAALKKLPPGRVFTLRVTPDRISAIIDHGRTRHVVQLGADGSKVDVKTPSVDLKLPGAKVVPAAPYRIARTAARRSHHSVRDVDYLVLSTGGWELFFKDGAHFHANASGTSVKKSL